MTDYSKKIHSVVHLDDDSEIICFCPFDEASRGRCVCREMYDCSEALISVEIIPGTKPSEKDVEKVKKVSRKAIKDLDKIKESLGKLEHVIKNSKFRI